MKTRDKRINMMNTEMLLKMSFIKMVSCSEALNGSIYIMNLD